jgi:hypothetical protein
MGAAAPALASSRKRIVAGWRSGARPGASRFCLGGRQKTEPNRRTGRDETNISTSYTDRASLLVRPVGSQFVAGKSWRKHRVGADGGILQTVMRPALGNSSR